jgi:hypothetical protein
MLNVTITESVRAGYAQVVGAGVPGSSSTVNVDGPGATRPNATITAVGKPGGAGSLFSIFDHAGGHLLPDLAGYFTTSANTNVLTGLVIAPASSPVPYNRDDYGDWMDADHDCQDTRAEVLIVEVLPNTLTLSPNGCTVAGGQWLDPYTNTVVAGPSNVDIDYMVPLDNAHRSGGWAWDAATKHAYANDLAYADHFIAVTDKVNQSKGDQGPGEWKPPYVADWCRYATDWVGIKKRWSLTVTEQEYDALTSMLTSCRPRCRRLLSVPSRMTALQR